MSQPALTRRALLAAAGAAPLAAASPGRAAPALIPVVAAFGAMDLTYLPNVVALERGFAAANGLALKLRITEGGPQARTMVAAGEATFQHGDSTLPLQLIGKGVPAKILLSTEAQAPYANLIVRQDLFNAGITTIEDLAAHKRPDGARPIVGVSTIGAGSWIWGTFLFQKIGRASAINFVAGGSSFTLLAALSSGRFDAVMGAPDLASQAATEKWGQMIFDVTSRQRWDALVGGPIPASAVYTLQSTIDGNPAMVAAYVKAILQSLEWIRAADNADIIAVVQKKYMPNISDAAIAYGMDFHRKTMNFSGVVDHLQFERASDVWFRPATGISPIAYADAVDARFLVAAP
jgi:NitT/TauT family transport system substrate-binding protein